MFSAEDLYNQREVALVFNLHEGEGPKQNWRQEAC